MTDSTQDLAGRADAWRPDPGDVVVGVLVSTEERDNGWGPYPVLRFRRDDGTETDVHAFRVVLQNELAKFGPRVGERLAIRYDGLRESKTGRPFHGYVVRVLDRSAAAMDWGRYGDPADAAAPKPPPRLDAPASPPVVVDPPTASPPRQR